MKNMKQFLQPNYLTILAIAFAFLAFGPLTTKTEKSVSVAVDKMNVFYIGVDNPITVAVEGIADEKVLVSSEEAALKKLAKGKYSVNVKKPGIVKIRVHGEGFVSQELQFRAKWIPDPVAGLQIGNGTVWIPTEMLADKFKKATGLSVIMEHFAFDINTSIVAYSIVKVPRFGEQIELESTTSDGSFDAKMKALVESAEPGDTFYFSAVKGKFPGDIAPRFLNSLVFHIK